eukprot:TRINITY_DN5253_c0_g1_i5.p1 TRINITY_DN5253_c0_g1~~TRINITY_DN5253_c0_g1_i5.p1  ORF type:complete len:526 (+),score=122.18 TRINITY_DN5253_c0_g1_i5:275-1852(+)
MSPDKLVIDVNSIQVTWVDFVSAMKVVTPTAHRAATILAKQLPPTLEPLLESHLDQILALAAKIFPFSSSKQQADQRYEDALDEDLSSVSLVSGGDQIDLAKISQVVRQSARSKVHRPRLMIHGHPSMGQHYLAAALLNTLEEFSIFSLDYATLNADISAKTIEESLVRVLNEAKRKLPAVLYMPRAPEWWKMASPAMQLILTSFLQDLDPSLPLFFIMTSDSVISSEESGGDESVMMGSLLCHPPCEYYEVIAPDEEARKKLFERALADVRRKPKEKRDQTKIELPVLPKADVVRPIVSLSPEQQSRQDEEDDAVLRELRIALRSILDVLFREKKYKPFYFPVDETLVPDYYQIIKEPISLVQMLEKVDNEQYLCLESFLDDIRLLVSNAEKYNPPNDPQRIPSRARALLDHTFSISRNISTKIIYQCRLISQRRSTKKVTAQATHPSSPTPTRRSARLRGEKILELPDTPESKSSSSHQPKTPTEDDTLVEPSSTTEIASNESNEASLLYFTVLTLSSFTNQT